MLIFLMQMGDDLSLVEIFVSDNNLSAEASQAARKWF